MMDCLDSFLAMEKLLLVHQGIFTNQIIRGPVGYTLDATTMNEILRLFGRLQAACTTQPKETPVS